MENFVESKELRDRVGEHEEIMDKVKSLQMLPDTDFISQEMVAKYFEVPVETIKTVVSRNKDELESSGYKLELRDVVRQRLKIQDETLANLGNKGIQVTLADGTSLLIPNRGLRTFTKKTVYRIGLLLRDSKVAIAIRNRANDLLVADDNHVQESSDYESYLQHMDVDTLQIELKKEGSLMGSLLVTGSISEALSHIANTEAIHKELRNRDKPKVDYYDTILSSEGTLNVTQIAKDYGMSAAEFNSVLNALHVQYKSAGQWLLYNEHQRKGYTKSFTGYKRDKTGGKLYSYEQTKWTQKGRLFLYNVLKAHSILPCGYQEEHHD